MSPATRSVSPTTSTTYSVTSLSDANCTAQAGDRTGSAAHMHYHLADAESGKNLFGTERDPRGLGLSPLCYHFLGGVLAHARALCAVTSPTVSV